MEVRCEEVVRKLQVVGGVGAQASGGWRCGVVVHGAEKSVAVV